MNQNETAKNIPDILTLNKIVKVLSLTIVYFHPEDEKRASFIKIFGNLNKKTMGIDVQSQ